MATLPQVRARDLVKVLLRHGFTQREGKGGHSVFAHRDGRRTVVPMHRKPLTKGTLATILRQSQLDVDELR